MAPDGVILTIYELDLTPIGERHLQLPIRLGRSSLNDVCVSHRLVSEFHARIEDCEGRLCVRDLSSTNGVLVERLGSEAARVAAQALVDLEPYGYEFLLGPLLRVRVRPASEGRAALGRQSRAVGSVLGNVAFAVQSAAALAEDAPTEGHAPAPPQPANARRAPAPRARVAAAPASVSRPAQARRNEPAALDGVTAAPAGARGPAEAPRAPAATNGAPSRSPAPPAARPVAGAGASSEGAAPPSASRAVQPYASVFIEPSAAPIELRAVARAAPPREAASALPVAARAEPPHFEPARGAGHAVALDSASTLPVTPLVLHTAWEVAPSVSVAGLPRPARPPEPPSHSLEALALTGLRELAASLVPGQPVESAADIGRLITKLHDALEMFCRCFIPVRETCARLIPPDELERDAIDRCRHRSSGYVAIERALEPRSVAGALLDWRSDATDAPLAVEHILADLMRHHLTFAQAALDGTRALLDELSPARIEAAATRSPSVLARLGLAGGRERLLWQAFAEKHARLERLGRSFRELFGEQFARAFVAHSHERGAPFE